MKIHPVILCGGSGSRLWPNSKNYQAKQFIDFGGWTLFEKTLLRVKDKLYDSPIIVTNKSYLKLVKKFFCLNKICFITNLICIYQISDGLEQKDVKRKI